MREIPKIIEMEFIVCNIPRPVEYELPKFHKEIPDIYRDMCHFISPTDAGERIIKSVYPSI